MQSMTAAQFISMIESRDFAEGLECFYDSLGEIRSEIALYGDSGPGTLYRARNTVRELMTQKATYERLTGRKFPHHIPALPMPR